MPVIAGLALYVLLSGANAQSLSQAITNMSSATITYMGYNETGFMNTSVVRRSPLRAAIYITRPSCSSLFLLDGIWF